MEFKIQSPSELIAAVNARTGVLAQIETAAQMKGRAFDDFYTPLIEALAQYVLECPLERYTYAEPGGALRFGLISAMFALRHTATRMFASGEGSERRRVLTEQYKFAAFAASIASVPAIVHSGIQVSVGEGANQQIWSPYHAYPQLERWLGRVGAHGYVISWKTAPIEISQINAAVFAADIFKLGTWANFDPVVVRDMYESIAPGTKSGKEGALWLTVKEGQTLARELEKKAASGPYTPGTVPIAVNTATVAAAGATPESISTAVKSGGQPTPEQQPHATPAPSEAPAQPAPNVAPAETAAAAAAGDTIAESSSPVVQTPDQPADVETPEPAQEENPVHKKARELLRKAPAHLAETLYAILHKPNIDQLRETWIDSEEGLDITAATLRELGRAPTLVAEDFQKYGLILRKYASQSPKRTGIILTPEGSALLRGEVDALVQ